MNMQNKHYKAVMDEVERLEKTGRYSLVKNFIQHGKTTVYAHCIDVALTACELAETHNFDVNYSAMITGALLHDHFLYDWHIPQKHFGLHGFTHPYTAANNAKDDYHIGSIEEDIIIHHMFPLTMYPPQSKEAWVVCWADKLCAARETVTNRLVFLKKAFQR